MIKEQIEDILNEKKFSLRKILKNEKYHFSQGTIPLKELSEEKEPLLLGYIRQIIPEIIKKDIFTVSYDNSTLHKDWCNLVKKDVSGDIDVRSKSGNLILDMYMNHIYEVKNYKGISVKNSLTQEIWEKSLYISICRHHTPYKSEIRRNISMALGVSSVTKYRAITAKKICSEFGAKSVLDPCVGWGGRMLGTICLDSKYVGFEPDIITFSKLQKVLEDDSIPRSCRKMATIINKPFEIGVDDINETFDMILTSPPYFNLEIYTSGIQSIDSFSSWESWKDWLKSTILSCIAKLNPGGTSCWSVKNIKTDKKYPIADVTISIHEEIGWKLVKIISLKGSSRDGKNVDTKESTYCFKKSTKFL